MKIEELAKVVYEAERALPGRETKLNLTWEQLGEENRARYVRGVRYLLTDPEAEALELQEEVYREMLLDGWTYGPELDLDAKTHPGMVTFAQLPLGARLMYELDVAIVRTLERSVIADMERSAVR